MRQYGPTKKNKEQTTQSRRREREGGDRVTSSIANGRVCLHNHERKKEKERERERKTRTRIKGEGDRHRSTSKTNNLGKQKSVPSRCAQKTVTTCRQSDKTRTDHTQIHYMRTPCWSKPFTKGSRTVARGSSWGGSTGTDTHMACLRHTQSLGSAMTISIPCVISKRSQLCDFETAEIASLRCIECQFDKHANLAGKEHNVGLSGGA